MRKTLNLFLLCILFMLLVACNSKEKVITKVTDNPQQGEEITMILKAYNVTYNGTSYSLVTGEDEKNYRVNITWKNSETEVEINKTYEITGKFGGKELTGFDSKDMIYSEFNMYDCTITD